MPAALGKQVELFRKKNKLSQTEFGNLIGKDRQYISKIENGKVSSSLTTISVIAYALDISLSELVDRISL
ncbi:XRE family transcriptional regulator [Chryseobacterium nakagawai]|uniref:XRE family transcriptional regulator n=1 Tax=Chryseobacterium nakagawai TaxID=1241982 RepID=A0AAD0YTH5_CHRNA|nr:XRE family transcriptional regulator [Chryseobacterium nakagawai]